MCGGGASQNGSCDIQPNDTEMNNIEVLTVTQNDIKVNMSSNAILLNVHVLSVDVPSVDLPNGIFPYVVLMNVIVLTCPLLFFLWISLCLSYNVLDS
jgi:hypothetical protein